MNRTERQSIRRWFSTQMSYTLAAVLAVFAPVAAAQKRDAYMACSSFSPLCNRSLGPKLGPRGRTRSGDPCTPAGR